MRRQLLMAGSAPALDMLAMKQQALCPPMHARAKPTSQGAARGSVLACSGVLMLPLLHHLAKAGSAALPRWWSWSAHGHP